MLEDRPVAVPADGGAGVVADDERLDQLVGRKRREPRRPFAQGQEPVRDRIGRRQARIVKVVAPAEGARKPLSFPAMELEGRETGRVDRGGEHPFLGGRDDVVGLREAGEERAIEQRGLLHESPYGCGRDVGDPSLREYWLNATPAPDADSRGKSPAR